MIDDRKPTGRIDPQVLTNSPLSGYESAIFDDPVHIFDDPDVLFGSQSTPIATMRTASDSNSPNINGFTYSPKSGTGDNAPNISIQVRR